MFGTCVYRFTNYHNLPLITLYGELASDTIMVMFVHDAYVNTLS